MISNMYLRSSVLLLAFGAVVACGSAPPPQELVDARAAYQRAQQSQAKQLSPAVLHDARTALIRAEQAFEQEGDASETRNLAYVAQRKAQQAQAEASTAELQRQERERERAREQTQAKAAAEAKGELQLTREQLATRERELAAERQARAEAEARSRAALEKLTAMGAAASVREEARGTVVTLPGTLMFASGKSELRPGARAKLDQVAEALVDQEDKAIVVEGHTDSTGADELNLALSRNRAENVRAYLISRGVSDDRITANGLGSTRPIADNATAEGRAENRRVEIVIQQREVQERGPR